MELTARLLRTCVIAGARRAIRLLRCIVRMLGQNAPTSEKRRTFAATTQRILLDLSYEDIADSLDVSSGTVASRLSRALAAMRAALEADERPLPMLHEVPEVE